MGFLDLFNSQEQSTLPTVTTILPPQAVAEIQQGRLPQLNTNTIFLKKGELCHYIDKAILIKEKVVKSFVRKGGSYSMPGLFKGTNIKINRGRMDPDEKIITEQFRGILYVTNKRIIFQANQNGFEKAHTSLTSILPYSNAVDLQYGSTNHSLLVPNGNLVLEVMDLLQKS